MTSSLWCSFQTFTFQFPWCDLVYMTKCILFRWANTAQGGSIISFLPILLMFSKEVDMLTGWTGI